MIKKTRRISLILVLALMCIAMASCQAGGQKTWPVEKLGAEEFTYYADNANVFADDVLGSGAKFLYVQLPCDDDDSLSEDDLTIANDNADGIVAMIKNDYHDVLDARAGCDDIATAIADQLALTEDSRILVIGDAAAESAIYEELVKTYNNEDYLNSQGVSRDEYDTIYDNATTAGWDAVIVACDITAFHMQSFPFAAE